MDASLLKPAIGTVRLVSETGADYNLVIVENYTNYIVENVLIDTQTVYFKNGAAPMVIDFSDNNISTVMTDETGNPLTLDNLAEWDVLSVCRDAESNTSVCRVYRSNRTVEGTIRELSLSEQEVVIDEKVYPIAYSMQTDDLKLGKNAAFFLDFTGAVSAMTEVQGISRTYAWLAAAQNTKGMDPVPQLKMFTEDGEWKVYKAADFVELNGARVPAKDLLANGKTGAEMYLAGTAPTLVDDTGAVVPQLIAYEVNEEELITKLETAYNMTKLDTPDEEKIGGTFSMDFYQNDARSSRFFNGTKAGTNAGLISGAYQGEIEYSDTMFTKVFIRPETKYFVIPGNLSNEKAYAMKKATNEITLERIRTNETDCQCFYDVAENYVCGVVVLRKDIQAQDTIVEDTDVIYPTYSRPAGLVLGVSTILSDGIPVTALKVYSNSGQEVFLDLGEIERAQYRNTNARMWDVIVGEETLKGDPDWYMLREDGTKYQPEKSSDAWKNTAKTARHNEIFIDLEDIKPGDIVQYEADDDGKLQRLCMVYRHEYPGDVEFSYDETYLKSTGIDLNYLGGNLSLNGTVKKVLDSGLLTEVNLPQGTTDGAKTTFGLPLAMKTTRMLPTKGKFAVWDTERGGMREITTADVVQGDLIFSWWQTTNQSLVVVYR